MRATRKLELQQLKEVLIEVYLGRQGIMDARWPIGERGGKAKVKELDRRKRD